MIKSPNTPPHASTRKPSFCRLLVILLTVISLGLVACNWVIAAHTRQSNWPPPCQILDPTHDFYPTTPVSYPATSDVYSVQYRLGGGDWLRARVHISYYGGTNSSPFRTFSGYTQGITSMSSVSIPAPKNTNVEIRVTKLRGLDFPAQGLVTVRPTPKPVTVEEVNGNVVRLSTQTPESFGGDQFILWYNSSAIENSALQGLVFFLDPPLTAPTPGPTVRLIQSRSDMEHLAGIDTLDFEGVVGDDNPYVFNIPAHVTKVYLGDNAWLRGKVRFEQDGSGRARKLYGHGVIDVSRFNYSLRHCGPASGYQDEGYKALSFGPLPIGWTPDTFTFNGFTISDTNFAATEQLSNCYLNDVKIISWNGNNGGLLLGDNNLVTNFFARDGDDTLMMWGSNTSVFNATVWQNYNGGVVNLGWGKESPGDSDVINGLYVVRTDWLTPGHVSWTSDLLKGHLAHENNAVFDSLMIPGTNFGSIVQPVFRNIYIEDEPRVLFSLRIVPPHLGGKGGSGDNRHPDLTRDGNLRLTIDNLSTPRSTLSNSIGFQTIEHPHEDGYPELHPVPYTLHGNIDVIFNGVTFRKADGTTETLRAANAATTGKIVTNGSTVSIHYGP